MWVYLLTNIVSANFPGFCHKNCGGLLATFDADNLFRNYSSLPVSTKTYIVACLGYLSDYKRKTGEIKPALIIEINKGGPFDVNPALLSRVSRP